MFVGETSGVNKSLIQEGYQENFIYRIKYLPQIDNRQSSVVVGNDKTLTSGNKTYGPGQRVVFDLGSSNLVMSSRNFCLEGIVSSDAPNNPIVLSESFHCLIKSLTITDSVGKIIERIPEYDVYLTNIFDQYMTVEQKKERSFYEGFKAPFDKSSKYVEYESDTILFSEEYIDDSKTLYDFAAASIKPVVPSRLDVPNYVNGRLENDYGVIDSLRERKFKIQIYSKLLGSMFEEYMKIDNPSGINMQRANDRLIPLSVFKVCLINKKRDSK